MNRRRFLQAAGATGAAAMTGLSGCSSLTGGGGGAPSGERASYDSWVAADQSGAVNAFTLDLEVYRTLQEDEEETQTQTETATSANTETDPLSGIPATYLFAAALGLGFGLSRTGLSSLISADGSARRAHFVDSGIVLEGSLDAEQLGSSVTSSGAEEVESYEGYTLYRRGSGGDTTVVGLSGDAAIVFSAGEEVTDPLARTRGLVDLAAGSATPLSDESDDFDALVTALPSQGLSAVTYSPDGGLFAGDGSGSDGQDGGGASSSGLSSFSDLDLAGNAVGGATSAAISDEQLAADVAILYESEGEVDAKADIEAALGGQADSSSVTIDGRMVYVEGTYEDPSAGN